MSLEELREEFSIEGYLELQKLFKDNFCNDYNLFKNIYSEIKKQENYQVLWYQDPQSKKLRFNKNIKDYINSKLNPS